MIQSVVKPVVKMVVSCKWGLTGKNQPLYK